MATRTVGDRWLVRWGSHTLHLVFRAAESRLNFKWCNIFFFDPEKKFFASVCCQDSEVRKFWTHLANFLNRNKSTVRS